MVFQNHNCCSFRVLRRVSTEFILGPILCSFFINNLPASLPSFVSCCLCADDLAIWSSSSVPTAIEATQGALIRLDHWYENWCLPLNPTKSKAFFLLDFHQANLHLHLFLFNVPSASILLQLLLENLRPKSFLFQTRIFAEGQVFFSSQSLSLYICFIMGLH